MKRYLVVTFVLVIPLYGLSRATQELVQSMKRETPKLVTLAASTDRSVLSSSELKTDR